MILFLVDHSTKVIESHKNLKELLTKIAYKDHKRKVLSLSFGHQSGEIHVFYFNGIVELETTLGEEQLFNKGI